MIDDQLRVLVRCDALLGEGPVWDAAAGALWWVDIKGATIFRWHEAGGCVDRFATPFQVAALAPAAGGGFIAATAHGFAHIDPERGLYMPLIHPEAHLPDNRFNDAKLDRHGAFWAGTLDDAETGASVGALYRLDRALIPRRMDSGYCVTNGPAFDRCGTRMYHTDSVRKTIYAFDLGTNGEPGERRLFLDLSDLAGSPDGMTVDSEDALWVAFWDGACLRRFAPDGELLREVAVPVSRPTSLAFGGAMLDILFVTSARIGLDAAALAAQPLAGSLFAFRPGATGIADTPFVWDGPAS